MYKYLLEKDGDHVISYLLDENLRAVEIRKDPLRETDSPGDIFKARIMNIVSGTGAAFVRYKEGVNGYLTRVRDAESIYQKMRAFLRLSFEEKEKMGREGRRRMEKYFDKDKVVEKTLIEMGLYQDE